MSLETEAVSAKARAGTFTLDRHSAERLTQGVWHGVSDQVELHGASIDSRHVVSGGIFACLSGTTNDGHDFASTAVGDGAALVLASRLVEVPVPVLLVNDVTLALGQLAREYRLRHGGTTWIGITGSNGKTTVKELIAASCAPAGLVHATRGDLNNALGVPLSILAMPSQARFAVIEMGANHQGEIAYLSDLVRPQVGIITSLGPAHLEGFGDLMGVAKAKSELFAALPEGAPALLGTYGLEAVCARFETTTQALLAAVHAAASGRKLQLVGAHDSPVRGTVLEDAVELVADAGRVQVRLLGAHNLANVALAFQAATCAGVSPAQALQGLATMTAVPGRLHARRHLTHLILDDTYNANPGSMLVALEVLRAYQTRTLAVLGAMGELGHSAQAGHAQVGAQAARLGLSVITVGDQARSIFQAYQDAGGPDAAHATDHGQALALVRRHLQLGPTTVLVKASRPAGLERLVAQLLAPPGSTP